MTNDELTAERDDARATIRRLNRTIRNLNYTVSGWRVKGEWARRKRVEAEQALAKLQAATTPAPLEPWICHQCGGPITNIVAASHGWYCSQGCRDAAEGRRSS